MVADSIMTPVTSRARARPSAITRAETLSRSVERSASDAVAVDPGGNRRLDSAFPMLAIIQIRIEPRTVWGERGQRRTRRPRIGG